ncbi:MAG: DNA helicase RecQ, partial [Flavobacteriales bacterium]|nr:DNA helicase RecQ [Flavobacteriales bacterium]
MEIEVGSDLKEALKKHFGFNQFKGEQEKIIKSVLEGNDTFVIMPTGGGKSLCYQLPALLSEGTAIVVSPLIALMKNQVDSIRSFGSERGIAHFLNSSLNKGEAEQVRSDIKAGITKLLYVAPESLNKQENIDFFKDVNISLVAIDEAHCISEWGHDFRPEYRRLRPMIEAIGNVPVMALTATATPKVQSDIQKNLGMNEANVFKSSFNRDNLYYEIRPKSKNVARDMIRYIKEHEGKSGIVYCLSRKKVEEMAESLQVNGIKALPYHAGLDAATRVKHQDAFLMEDADVICATIAFGMGIDKPDVRYVIHHDIPKSLEGYYQETGRAGRDGGEGNCLAFYSYDDIAKLEKFMQGKPISEQEIGKQLLGEVVSYVETSVCRRKFILHYFGEEFDAKGCNEHCDNCKHPKKQEEAQDELTAILQTVVDIKEKFKSKHVINIMLGTNSSQIKSYKHDTLDAFGEGAEKGERYWQSMVRQAVIHGYLTKDIENYGLLKLTDVGQAYLDKPTSFMMTIDHDYEAATEAEDAMPAGAMKGGGSTDDVLLKMLKDLRKDISKEENLPPFVIFQDPSLEDMAFRYPITMDELTDITGVGAGKAKKYGEPFLELIQEYVEENEIEREQDMVVKTVVNKSSNKVYIIQSIDRKLDLEDIADAKGLSMDDLLTEIEHIVSSGTKVNIDYYINEEVDEDKQDDIYEYFQEEAETDSIEAALAELGEDDYTEQEVRLVRIK